MSKYGESRSILLAVGVVPRKHDESTAYVSLVNTRSAQALLSTRVYFSKDSKAFQQYVHSVTLIEGQGINRCTGKQVFVGQRRERNMVSSIERKWLNAIHYFFFSEGVRLHFCSSPPPAFYHRPHHM